MKNTIVKTSIKVIAIIAISIALFLIGYVMFYFHLTKPLKIDGLNNVTRTTYFQIFMNDYDNQDTGENITGMPGYYATSDELTFFEREKIFNLIQSMKSTDVTVKKEEDFYREFDIVIQFTCRTDFNEAQGIGFVKKTIALTPTTFNYDMFDNTERNQFIVSERKFSRVFDDLFPKVKQINDALNEQYQSTIENSYD